MPVRIPNIGKLDHRQLIEFPNPEDFAVDGLVAVGGNLSPGMLLSAYIAGSFPWFDEHSPDILWWSPDPRCVFYPSDAHISKRLLRETKKNNYTLITDNDFSTVIKSCAAIERPGQMGTWITDSMISAYTALHELGYAHSFELYKEDRLIGGFYGVAIGSVFFGESMFSLEPHASKTAFLMARLIWERQNIKMIDCQVKTQHLLSMGAKTIKRKTFLKELSDNLKTPFVPKKWSIKIIGNLLSCEEILV